MIGEKMIALIIMTVGLGETWITSKDIGLQTSVWKCFTSRWLIKLLLKTYSYNVIVLLYGKWNSVKCALYKRILLGTILHIHSREGVQGILCEGFSFFVLYNFWKIMLLDLFASCFSFAIIIVVFLYLQSVNISS